MSYFPLGELALTTKGMSSLAREAEATKNARRYAKAAAQLKKKRRAAKNIIDSASNRFHKTHSNSSSILVARASNYMSKIEPELQKNIEKAREHAILAKNYKKLRRGLG